MIDCKQLDPLVTPYVDGDLGDVDRDLVDRHLTVCLPCRGRVHGERAVRALIRTRKPALESAHAPDVLQARCAALAAASQGAAVGRPSRAPGWRTRLMPFALAAGLALIVGGAFLYELTDRSSRLMAAELTVDHMKCFGVMNDLLGTDSRPAVVEASMASGFGWHVRLPDPHDAVDLQLVGSRPCLYAEGRVAHIMYRHHGTPISVFMLPRTARSDQMIEVLGHEAAIWSVGDRTFVVIARASRAEVERIAAFVQGSLR
jgi:anti-sigma factor RsiW